MSGYQRRLLDDELDELLPSLAAIAIEGPKGVGKSATAERRANTVLRLDELAARQTLETYPARLDDDATPILLDEWQRMPSVWDLVRRSVDRNRNGGRFLLTGSATPIEGPMHSGAGRIVRLRMRPMSLVERRPEMAVTVGLADLLTGSQNQLDGRTAVSVDHYVDEILSSGFPGIRDLSARSCAMQLDGYIERIVDVDFAEQGQRIRRPATLRAWLRSYAAATATTTTYTSILDAATPGVADKPAKSTTIAYRDVLERLWILEPVPGWLPTWNHAARLASAPKHHLADPALSARLLGASKQGLLTGTGAVGVRDGLLLGALFESLVVQSVRTYAQRSSATVHHLRTADGAHEVDVIVEGDNRRVVAIETKLSGTVTDDDVKHLKWLMKVGGDRIADAIVVTTGEFAYRRPDGIGVVPFALLGP